MGLHGPDADGVLWFITALDADKDQEAAAEEQVSVSCAKGEDRWVSVAGTARPVRDRAKLEALWSPFVEAWFPGGPADPNVGLLRVEPRLVAYWESTMPKPVRYLQMLGAAVLQRPPDVGEMGTLRLGKTA
jgi:general stress protein 26